MSSFCRYRVKKPRKATALLRFFLVPTKIWHFKTAKHPKSFSFRIIGCFFDAPILLVLQGEKRPKMGKIKFLGRVHPALLSLRLIYSKKQLVILFSAFCGPDFFTTPYKMNPLGKNLPEGASVWGKNFNYMKLYRLHYLQSCAFVNTRRRLTA